jgi:hypothetical protein
MFAHRSPAAPRRLLVACAAALVVALAPRAALAEEPTRGSASPERAAEELESNRIDAGAVAHEPALATPDAPVLVVHEVPAGADHAAAFYTTMDRGDASAAPTAGERLKLDAARAAIAASRARGVHAPGAADGESIELPMDQAALLAEKWRRWEDAYSAPVAPSEVSGIGIDFPAIQEIGPSGLNAIEEAKLRGDPIPTAPVQAPAQEPTPESQEPRPNQAPDSKEASHE